MRTASARLLLACASVSAVLLLCLGLSGDAAAVDDAGTWTDGSPGNGFIQDTWPADWHYQVRLTLSGGSGTWWMKVASVTNVQRGQESAKSTIGNSFSYAVTYTSTSSGINLVMQGKTLPLRVSGGKMTGSGSYNPGDGSTLRWTVNLKGGSGMGAAGEMASVAMAGAAVGVAGGIAGMAAAAAPAPKPVPSEGRILAASADGSLFIVGPASASPAATLEVSPARASTGEEVVFMAQNFSSPAGRAYGGMRVDFGDGLSSA